MEGISMTMQCKIYAIVASIAIIFIFISSVFVVSKFFESLHSIKMNQLEILTILQDLHIEEIEYVE